MESKSSMPRSKRRGQASKENVADPDLIDFQLVKKRFKQPQPKETMATLSKGFVPNNTAKNTTWACKVFSDWVAERNENDDEEECPRDLLTSPTVQKLNYWLS